MAKMGTVKVNVMVDARRVKDILAALHMLECLVGSTCHTWTDEELDLLEAAYAACDRKHLVPADD